MKILHICLAGTVTDGWTYQENKLLKFHRALGHDVTLITSRWVYGNDSKLHKTKLSQYILDDGVKVIRLEIINRDDLTYKFKKYNGLMDELIKLNPDIIFVHGCQFLDLDVIRRYVKKNKTVLYIDNHADYSNSATSFLSLFFLHKIIWRRLVKRIEPYVKKFYGVLPARVDFLKRIYKTPAKKTELLVMGGDDEMILVGEQFREKTRSSLLNNEDDFLIVTGGKIDRYKKQVLECMRIIGNSSIPKLVFVLFGSVDKSIREEFNSLVNNKNVKYFGWADELESYKLFSASDLILFPGRHSVYWEQAASQGKPMILKDWEGTHHLDFGGNVVFWQNDDYDELKRIIENIVLTPDIYLKMCEKANLAKGNFSYRKIAMKCIEEYD